ncbi:cryptochrome/deoxyribodipyrimidine photo-lyase family protein [Lacibacter sp. H407]|uniref:cryptochrome/deoxyribodipyrimidine photo-lyase family protein n=1 Tax=Lacibacter sp. H407 TaxID=3133423 RepID=UPI0030C26245
MQELINIVWFKKDLRLTDHAPLAAAVKNGLPVLLLHFFEPGLMGAADSDERHWRFIYESIEEIKAKLHYNQIHFYSLHAEVIPVLQELKSIYNIKAVFSHEETGNAISYERDKAVAVFCKQHNIQWIEHPTNGIIRGLTNRKNWSERWTETMTSAEHTVELSAIQAVQLPASFDVHDACETLPKNLTKRNPLFQPGGETAAWRYLHSFLNERYVTYSRHISKPEESRKSCSRISPYLTYGNVSMKQVYQATVKAAQETSYKRPLHFFTARLHWHCHFIQKFESECRMEFENLNRGFDVIRTEVNEEYLKAWKNGVTGVPLIDACMRCVTQTGYLNFRMRSMLASFLTHHLWQPWQAGAAHLARQFLDYEPGIHYPQFQMQAGTMGVNTIRIYNPVKQGKDHDPEGFFIRKWIPELIEVPVEFIHEPWLMSSMEQQLHKLQLGVDYPLPIIDVHAAAAFARKHLWDTKKSKPVIHDNKRVLEKHTKRK